MLCLDIDVLIFGLVFWTLIFVSVKALLILFVDFGFWVGCFYYYYLLKFNFRPIVEEFVI